MTGIDPADVQLWPLVLGWGIVSLLYLFGWKRQALIATAGMAIVSLFILSVVLTAWRT
jgi:hypothetical protein